MAQVEAKLNDFSRFASAQVNLPIMFGGNLRVHKTPKWWKIIGMEQEGPVKYYVFVRIDKDTLNIFSPSGSKPIGNLLYPETWNRVTRLF